MKKLPLFLLTVFLLSVCCACGKTVPTDEAFSGTSDFSETSSDVITSGETSDISTITSDENTGTDNNVTPHESGSVSYENESSSNSGLPYFPENSNSSEIETPVVWF